MRFTQQLEVIATFALFIICVYANPMGNQLEVPGQLMNRQLELESRSLNAGSPLWTWCGGLTNEQCQTACDKIGPGYKHHCSQGYVN